MGTTVPIAEIRDSKLYRSQYRTFEAYCQSRWGWNRTHAQHLITAAETVKTLPEKAFTIVNNEGQAREVAKVEPAQRAQVVTHAAEQARTQGRPMKARSATHPYRIRLRAAHFKCGCG